MTNEEFQKLVLEKLVALEQGQTNLAGYVENIEANVENIETKIENIEANIENIETKIENIKAHMPTKSDVERIATEQQKDVVAMLNLMNGKLDKQAEILKILSSRSIEQEAEIIVLKKVK